MSIFEYIQNRNDNYPLFIQGDSLEVLKTIDDESIDCCVTSPPYWGKRQYESGGIGLETSYGEYIDSLFAIICEVQRVLKPSGSFWLNIGDTYCNKSLQGIPWRVALRMIDSGWILRNDVIWNKQKGGMCPQKDRFGNIFENFFFFVKSNRYYFNADAIRTKSREARIKNGEVISATGVSGIKYRRQIELSTSLTSEEKRNALQALDRMKDKIRNGEISDFRMIVRNQQRTTHSDSTLVSGRAKELIEKGFYFLCYNPKGTMPNDVWDILPEDTQNRKEHFAPYPEELCIFPIRATCPEEGIVLDPFSGTGTTAKVAYDLGRKSIGIDISAEYNRLAQKRIVRKLF